SQPIWNCCRSPPSEVATASAGTCQRSVASWDACKSVESAKDPLPYWPTRPRPRAFFLRGELRPWVTHRTEERDAPHQGREAAACREVRQARDGHGLARGP